MYAVFQTGGKQYRVIKHQVVQVERLNANIGDQIIFDQVLVIQSDHVIQIGTPFIKDGAVLAKVITHGFAPKIEIVKFRRRKHFRKRQGHRQQFTKLEIMNININTM